MQQVCVCVCAGSCVAVLIHDQAGRHKGMQQIHVLLIAGQGRG
jgi:chemotaxis receptor (MCP) glutamine deamidase CheD